MGGDFDDIFQVAEHEWVVTIGDVQGKGVQAAAVTALARHVLRAAAVRSPSPRGALLTLNDVLRRSDSIRLLTALVMRPERHDRSWRTVVASGGHEPPVWGRAGEPAEELEVPVTILGVFAAPSLSERRLDLGVADLLVLTTDGVHEARHPASGEFYGVTRLLDHVEAASVHTAGAVVGIAVGD